jgi:hypothetical protein
VALAAIELLVSNAPVRMHQYQRTIAPLSVTVAMSKDIVMRSARRRGAMGNWSSPAIVSRYAMPKRPFVHSGITVPGWRICVIVDALEPVAVNADAMKMSSHPRRVAGSSLAERAASADMITTLKSAIAKHTASMMSAGAAAIIFAFAAARKNP